MNSLTMSSKQEVHTVINRNTKQPQYYQSNDSPTVAPFDPLSFQNNLDALIFSILTLLFVSGRFSTLNVGAKKESPIERAPIPGTVTQPQVIRIA